MSSTFIEEKMNIKQNDCKLLKKERRKILIRKTMHYIKAQFTLINRVNAKRKQDKTIWIYGTCGQNSYGMHQLDLLNNFNFTCYSRVFWYTVVSISSFFTVYLKFLGLILGESVMSLNMFKWCKYAHLSGTISEV